MNIPEISVFTTAPIELLTVDSLRAGIERRLELLTYLFCPDDEIEPAVLLKQLRIEETSDGTLIIRWRPRMRYPIRVYRFGEELEEQLEMASFVLDSYPAKSIKTPLRIIESAVDGVGFWQGYDRDDMGWPVVIAAASTLVDQAGGAIVSGEYGWLVPHGNEVRWILDPENEAESESE